MYFGSTLWMAVLYKLDLVRWAQSIFLGCIFYNPTLDTIPQPVNFLPILPLNIWLDGFISAIGKSVMY